MIIGEKNKFFILHNYVMKMNLYKTSTWNLKNQVLCMQFLAKILNDDL